MDFLNVPNNFAMAGNVNLQPLPLTNKRPLQTQPPAKTQVQPPSKPQMHPPSKPQMQQRYKAVAQPVKKPQPTSKLQMQPPSKPRQSFENVRSKFRESLSAALALVGQAKNTQQPDESKSSQSEAANQVKVEVPANQEAATFAMQSSAEPQPAESTMAIVDRSCPMTENPVQGCMANNSEFSQSVNEVHNSLVGNSVDEKLEFAKMWSYDQVFNPSDIFPEEETSFVVKDDLLQGNGLCWASDLDLDNFDINDMRDPKKPKLMQEVSDVQIENSPQTLAAKIEEELFILFGGVNKKYKEKGRSLLFNLKDPSNPELRERVISGEIPPERLCSMTAEELASKELSEWRIAKAEELAQMVVLPDEVNLRRVVKKTHKGEFQVEYEQDDGASVEVAVGQSSLITIPSRTSGVEGEKTDETKSKTTGKTESDGDNLITLTHDNTDFMQGLMVDDELKDTEFLPPIVSLDEFMESLDNEPPFENLPTNGAENATSDKGKSEITRVVMDGANSSVKDSVGASPKKKQAKEDTKSKKTGNDMKSDESKVESKVLPFVDKSKGEKIWSGILQLSISSAVTVLGFFKSGEKTSTKDWPSLLEIKGRVRLDAFGKFLQELPQSRSRAIMILEFCWQEGSSESAQSKVVDSYVADERVGLAEPAPGVELYVCPPHFKTSELLSGLIPKDHVEAVKTIDSGLIGIVVWRRAMSTVISPRTSSLQRQNSRKHHSPSQKKQQQEKSPGVRPPPIQTQSEPPMNNDPLWDDDVPPGFGPGAGRAARDEDDLPEFEFGQTMNHTPSTPAGSAREVAGRARPVEQVRDLIHKYGQSKTTSSPVNWGPHGSRGTGIEIQPWNDDDDIPDWQPGHDSRPQSHPLPAPPLPVAQYPAGHPYQQHAIYSHMASTAQPQQLGLQPPVNFHSQVVQLPGQQANWSTPAYASGGAAGVGQAQQLGYFGGHRADEQYYRMPGQIGMDWRPRHQ